MRHLNRRIMVVVIRVRQVAVIIRVVIAPVPWCVRVMVGFPVTGRIGRVRSRVRRSRAASVRWAIATQSLRVSFGFSSELLAPQCLSFVRDDILMITKAFVRTQFEKGFLLFFHVELDYRMARNNLVSFLWTRGRRRVMVACFTPSPDHVFERVPIT